MSDHLKVLFVALDAGRAAMLEERIREIGNAVLLRAPPDEKLPDSAAAVAPDVIIIDMARPERAVLDDLRRIGIDSPRPILMFTGHDDPLFMEEAIAAGISSCTVVKTTFPELEPLVTAAVAIFRRHRQVIEDLQQAKAMLTERETINQAKKLLMSERNMDEPRAYRWLRRKAMKESRPIAAIAADLIARKDHGEDPGLCRARHKPGA